MTQCIEGDSVLIVGFGTEGKSTLAFLRRHCPNKQIAVADQEPRNDCAGLVAHFGSNYLDSILDYHTVIRSPGVKIPERIVSAAREKKICITSATSIFFERCPGTVIGITGTKGKSTTSSLIAHLLRTQYPDVRLAGNIGKPMLDVLEGADSKTIFVIELSSYQLDDLRISPTIAVVLNIVPEHLNYHGSFESYLGAKANIARFQSAQGILLYNPLYNTASAVAALSPARKVCFSEHPGDLRCFHQHGSIFADLEGQRVRLFDYENLRIKGSGNLQNVLAACSVALELGVSLQNIRESIVQFEPLEHRMEQVGTYRGITFINDSLSTVPEAMINAVEAFSETIETVIAGGFDRGLDFSVLTKPLQLSAVKNLILFPTTGEAIWRAVSASADPNRFAKYNVQSMEQAVELAYSITSPGRVCLLSPASPSFSVFKDYKERGDKFKQIVRAHGANS